MNKNKIHTHMIFLTIIALLLLVACSPNANSENKLEETMTDQNTGEESTQAQTTQDTPATSQNNPFKKVENPFKKERE